MSWRRGGGFGAAEEKKQPKPEPKAAIDVDKIVV